MTSLKLPLNAVDLFCGVGGLSMGFQNAGIKIVASYDNWDKAIDIYNANFIHKARQFDLSNVPAAVAEISAHSFDMIIGGPPCQDFSHAGKRIEQARADLTIDYAAIITALKPRIFVMENVDRIKNSNAWKTARHVFKESGYGLTESVLNASFCGVPQKRKRYICIGILDSADNALSLSIEQNLTAEPMTIREYMGAELDIDFYYRHPRNYCRRGIFSIDEPSPTVRGVNRPIPKGYPGHPNDPISVSPSLRQLTSYERSRIQTFPKDFLWKGSSTDVEQMIGNAVPVNLATFIAKIIAEYVADKEK